MQEIKQYMVNLFIHFYFAVAFDKSRDTIRATPLYFDLLCWCQQLLKSSTVSAQVFEENRPVCVACGLLSGTAVVSE